MKSRGYMTSFVTQEYGKVKTGVPNDVIFPTSFFVSDFSGCVDGLIRAERDVICGLH